MKASPVLLQRKYTRLIVLLAARLELSLGEALDAFMTSKTYLLMREGIGDTHCLSDEYLVAELLAELGAEGKIVAGNVTKHVGILQRDIDGLDYQTAQREQS